MNEQDFCRAIQGLCEEHEEQLNEAIEEVSEPDEQAPQLRAIRTFDESGVMTMNQGLVFRMNDGSEYQVTVVQSRGPG